MSLKIVHISDTHNYPLDVTIKEEGNLLIHSGDLTSSGTFHETIRAVKDLASLKSQFDHIILVPGNHDWLFERGWENAKLICEESGIILLNDSEFIYDGVKIWGSPITPTFFDWAFNRDRGDDIKKHWDMIPEDTNILVTHGPPLGKLDLTPRGGNVGCWDLAEKIKTLKQLKLHLFGHIHEQYGHISEAGITYSNGSLLNERYILVNKPNVFELDKL